ncbi:MAG: hypothetical protein QNI84_12135 [Henriciella sp.]|nr:hypothetical protein [Henriciella sp.]
MFGLSLIDWMVITIYFIGLTGVGIACMRAVKTTGDYFMGGRGFGRLLMIGHAFGTGTHTDQPVAVTGACYQIGLAGIWYQWLWMFSTPFYWLISPIYRRLRYVTIGEFFSKRYGEGLGAIYAVMGLVYFALSIGLMLKGTAVTIDAISGGGIPSTTAVLIMTVLFVVYSIAGGIVAAVVTDFIQGIFILILSLLLIPFALGSAGGMTKIHQGLDPSMFSFVAPVEVTLFFITMVVVNGLVGIVVMPHHAAIGGAGKTEMACRTGWTYGNFLKRFVTLAWAFTGVFAAFLFPGLVDREEAFGVMVRELLPAGLVGLMLASMAAAVMSTCDSFMVGGAALFNRHFYRPMRPDRSETHYLSVARWASLLVVVLGVVIALTLPSVVKGLTYIWKITAFFGIGFWMAVVWKRANRWGVVASLVVATGCVVVTGDYTPWSLNWSLPAQIALYLPAGFLAFIIGALVTRPEDPERLRQFYTLIDTPVGEEARLKAEGVEVVLEGANDPPKGARFPLQENGHRLILPNLLSIAKGFSFKRYRIDILGFAGATGVVAGMFLLGYLTSRIGAI